MHRRALSLIRVRPRPGSRTRGILLAGPRALQVVLGRGGIRANKFEGDGATPRGRFRLIRLWWRADRHPHPSTLLPARRINPSPIAATTVPSNARPMTAATAYGGTITSTISSSRSIITRARAWRVGAAPSSFMWRDRIGRRRRDAWRSRAMTCNDSWQCWDRRRGS